MPGNRPTQLATPVREYAQDVNPSSSSLYEQVLASMESAKKPLPLLRLKIGQEVTLSNTTYKRLNPKHVGTIKNIITYGRYSDVYVDMKEGKYKGKTLYVRPENCIKIDKNKLPGWF